MMHLFLIFSSWLLPLLLQKIKTVTCSPGAIVLTNRLVQSVIIPSMASSTGASKKRDEGERKKIEVGIRMKRENKIRGARRREK